MPLPAFRALSFDLFDTLVDLHMEDLPEFRVGERTMRGTHAELHRVASRWISLDLPAFVERLLASDRELWESTYKVDRELPTLQRFRSFARSVGVDDDACAEALCDAHMRGIESLARTLPHHRDVLDRLGAHARLTAYAGMPRSGDSRTYVSLAVEL